MKKLAISICALAGIALSAFSQTNYAPIFNSILENNPTLKALRMGTDAAKDANMTGLNLADPEVEFAYQWGPLDKINVDVSQTFDFPTLSGNKKRVAESSNRVAEAEYQVYAMEVLAEADQTLTTLAYYQKKKELYVLRQELLRKIAELSDDLTKKGVITAVESAQSRLEFEKFNSENALMDVELKTLEDQLLRLNGGKPLDIHSYGYDLFDLPADFDSWFAGVVSASPTMLLADERITLGQENVRLSKSLGLPDFSVGYTNELIRGDNHHGFKVGMSLPLWSNSGVVKAARAEVAAQEAARDDVRFQLEADLRMKYDKAATLKTAYENYSKLLNGSDLQESLDNAYRSGRLPLHEYMQQLSALAELQTNVLDMERDYRLALCDLKAAMLR